MENDVQAVHGLSPAADKALRILIVALILLAVGGAVRWRMLSNRVRRAERLYRNYQYEDAVALLEPVGRSAVARIRLRRRARPTLLLCKAHLAAEEQTATGFEAALRHLAAAREAGAAPEDVDEYIEAYTAEKERLQSRERARPPNEENP